jgi:hypothetical protein
VFKTAGPAHIFEYSFHFVQHHKGFAKGRIGDCFDLINPAVPKCHHFADFVGSGMIFIKSKL